MKNFLFTILLLGFLSSYQLSYSQESGLTNPGADSINRTDAGGTKTGPWVEKQGEITYKGEYLAGKKVKSWVGYYSNNLIYKVEYYTDGLKDGICLQFDKKCKISLVEHYRNGLANGLTTLYSQYNEIPLSETEYVNGKKNGYYRQYYDNGKLQEESYFRDDKKNGQSLWNNKNGRLMAQYNYKDGGFDGIQKTYYDNDSLQEVKVYKDNQLTGESKEYYRNGRMKLSGQYLNGLKEGPWTEYDELGKVVRVVKFKGGVEVKK